MSRHNNATPRLGLIGFGAIARRLYAPHLKRRGIEWTAIDPLPESRAAATRAGAQRVDAGLDELFGRDVCDALCVLSPPASHLEVTRRAIERGLPCLVEKPASAPGQGPQLDDLIEAVNGSNVPVAVDLNRRFWGTYRELRRWTRTRGPTEIAVELQVPPSSWRAATSHRLDPAHGGALFDLGSHVVDLATFLVGRAPSDVAWSTRTADFGEVELHFVAETGDSTVAVCTYGTQRLVERTVVRASDEIRTLADPHGFVWKRRPLRAADLAAKILRAIAGRTLLATSVGRVLDLFVSAVSGDTHAHAQLPTLSDWRRVAKILEWPSQAGLPHPADELPREKAS